VQYPASSSRKIIQMYPFLENTRNLSDGSARRIRTLQELTADVSYLHQLAEHSASLKFWLSEPAYDALASLSSGQDTSVNEWLRGFFAMHCYGTYVISDLLKRNSKFFKNIDHGIRFSRASPSIPRGFISQPTYFVPELGKNVVPVKVWLADVQKADLKILAVHAKITLSEYCREIVTARMLGHGTLPMRPGMLAGTPNDAAKMWLEDEEAKIPYRQVEKSAFVEREFGYTSSEWVPDPS
jgi:hypothetical protein